MRTMNPDPLSLTFLGHDRLVRDGPIFGGTDAATNATNANTNATLARIEYDKLVERRGGSRPVEDSHSPPRSNRTDFVV